MSRRPAHGRPGNPRPEPEAAAIVASIDRLLRQLERKPVMAEHPDVEPVIHRLSERLAVFEQAGHSPGRHRAEPGQLALDYPAESAGPELELDLAAVRTPGEFVALLKRQVSQSGLPLRVIAARAKQKRVYSTISAALNRDKLPTIEVVEAIIAGCDGSENVLQLFTAAWHRLSAQHATGRTKNAGPLPAPIPSQWSMPGI